MSWFLIAASLLKVLLAARAMAKSQPTMTTDAKLTVADILKGTADDIRTATDIRNSLRADIERDPDSVFADDGFRRNGSG